MRRCFIYFSSALLYFVLLLLLSLNAATSAPSFEHTHGPKRLLYILCQYSDQSVPPTTASVAESSLAQVAQFYSAESRQQTTLTYAVTDPIVLPETASYYASTGIGQLYTEAVEIARSRGWDGDDYDFVFIRHSEGPGGVGVGLTGEKGAWVQTDNLNVLAHELGHNYGLDHANAWRPLTTAAYGIGVLVDYGDPYDLMGPNRGSFSPYEQSVLHWLPECAIKRVTTNGLFRLYALDVAPFASNRLYSLVVRKDVRDYWLDYRGQFQTGQFAPFTQNSLQIRWGMWSQSRGGSTLLDTTPGSPHGLDDGSLLIGRTFSDTEAGVHITVVNRSTTPGEWLDVAVQFSSLESNSAPAAQIMVTKTSAAIGEAISFNIVASDPDGDSLAYGWETSADGGSSLLTVSSNSPLLTYSWANAGRYEVRCGVSDMHGHLVNRSVVITIGTLSNYSISGVVVDDTDTPVPNIQVFSLATFVSTADGGYISHPTYRAGLTDDAGRFNLLNIPSGSYSVRAMPSVTHEFSHTNGTGQVAVGPDATNFVLVASKKPSVSVRGFVRDGSSAVSNIVLQFGPFTTVSRTDGSFVLSNVPPASYILSVAGNEQFFCQQNPIYVDGLEITNAVIERVLYRVRGTVPRDLGLVRVGMLDGKRRVLARPDFEDPFGDWTYEILLPRGKWNLEATLSGYTFAPIGFTNPVVIVGVEMPEYTADGSQPYSLSNFNFHAMPATFSIKGRIMAANEPLSAARVSIGMATEHTDDLGFYQFVGLAPGGYAPTASMSGYELSPSGFTNPVHVGPSATSINFSAARLSSPAISAQPQSQIVNLGSDATFSVIANGTPLPHYQWYFNNSASIVGATNSVLTVPNVQDEDGGLYSVVVSNGTSVTSSNALLTVNHLPVAAVPVLERYAFNGGKLRISAFLGSDSDDDPLSLYSVGPGSAAGGTVTTNLDWVIYTPPPGFTNTDSFPFVVNDGRGGFSSGTASVNVTFDNLVPQNFRAEIIGDRSVRLIFDGIQNRTYSVEFTENISSPSWQKLADLTADANGVFVYTDSLPNGAPQRFYRAAWP